ncbi:MAG: hypothetical protein WC366_04580 [Bacilli bacterium]|jgi:hypothetical protein
MRRILILFPVACLTILSACHLDIFDSVSNSNDISHSSDNSNLSVIDSVSPSTSDSVSDISDISLTELTQDDFPNTLYTVTGSSASSSSGSEPTSEKTTQRIDYHNPVISDENYAAVYAKTKAVDHFIKKGLWYTNLDDVITYLLAFKELPDNYYVTNDTDNGKSICYSEFGNYCRLSPGRYSTSDRGPHPYADKNKNLDGFPTPDDGYYWEYDVGYVLNGTTKYAGGSSFNRGPLRLIIYYEGIQDQPTGYGNIPTIFYTYNHYETFFEYANYENGWSKEYTSYKEYLFLNTI